MKEQSGIEYCGWDSGAMIANNLIIGNSGPGGGVECWQSAPSIVNNTMVGNLPAGVRCNGCSPEIINCIVWGNYVGQITDFVHGVPAVNAIVKHSCVESGFSGIGNISGEPLFVDSTNGDYHLQPDSPCIDTGDPNYVAEPNETDLDGKPRVIGGLVDMGAYESQLRVIEVAVDIKPQSCPNPLNVKSLGLLPVAVLGSEDFDVSSIDAASIRLAGVAPIRSSYENVATPVSDSNECECSIEGPDGFLDLTLKFETRRIVGVIGEVNDGDELMLELTGVLSDETPIEGSDCVIIRGRHKPLNKADFDGDGTVDMADFAAFAENWLQSSIVEY